LGLWKIINEEDAILIPKNQGENFPIFAFGIFWGGVGSNATIPLIVTLSPGHSDITRFCPWLPITTGNHLDRTGRKNSKVAQTIGTIDVFDLRSGILGPTSQRASTCPNING